MIDPITQSILLEDKIIQEVEPISALVGTSIAIGSFLFLMSKLFDKIDQWERKECYGKEGRELKICMKKMQVIGNNKKIAIAKNLLAKCSKAKEPATCKSKINAKINKLKEKNKKLEIEMKEDREKSKLWK